MSENTIPEDVIEGLAEVRESGRTNMFDREAVTMLMRAYGYSPEADWLDEQDDHTFMQALITMGDRISG